MPQLSGILLTVIVHQGQQLRDARLPIPTPSPTLGVTLQWTPLSSTEDVWHILEVIPNSPADVAGLLPYGDYIVGTPEGIVHGESGLGELVEDYLSRPLRLFVYNHEYAVTRLVTITPSRNWGGEGALGCILGFGALHRLPPPLAEPPQAPGDTLFETVRFSNEESQPRSSSPSCSHGHATPSTSFQPMSPSLIVPASMAAPPPLISKTSPPPTRASRKQRNAASPNRAFDEYWKESEERSREEDFAPKLKSTPLPPPPKLGVATQLPVPPQSGGEPRQTRSPDPILDDEDE